MLLLTALLPALALPFSSGSWRFVLPPAGDPDEHPPLRAIALSHQCPGDVKEMVHYRGPRQRYAQLRYGSPDSTPVTLVLDEVGPDEADLYVDAGRNLRIEPGDRVAATATATATATTADRSRGQTWRVPLRLALVEGALTHYLDRALVFRRGARGLTFSAAAAGYLEGEVQVDGRTVRARRVDGDCNGLLTDAQDRLYLDLDGDGRFDPVTEQFLYAPILVVAGRRYAVRSDELGGRLALDRLEASGTIRLALGTPGLADRVRDLAVTLKGRDGSAVGLRGLDAAAEAPAGDYRLGTVTLALDDPQGGPRWHFVFSDNGGRPEHVWHSLGPGQALVLDPIGRVEPAVSIEEGPKPCRPGDLLRVRPAFFTGDGLLINTCYRGDQSSRSYGGPAAEVTLVSPSSNRPAGPSASSGFACGTFCPAPIRVPSSWSAGALTLHSTFDSGPLAGRIHATIDLDIDTTPPRKQVESPF